MRTPPTSAATPATPKSPGARRARARLACLVAGGLALLAGLPRPAHGTRPGGDPDGPRWARATGGGPAVPAAGRGAARPGVYEVEIGQGGLHTIGAVWMHMDNTNYSPGNPWWLSGLNADPGEQWPGNSGVEYLLWSSLWVAGKDKQGVRRVSEFDEIRGENLDFARTRHAYEGMAGGLRGEDDDSDGRVDEDFLNGKDDDGDGRVDEDFGAISPDMWACEMLDYTAEAVTDPTYDEPHVPLGLKVRRSSFAWSTPGGSDFVGVHYDITNDSRRVDGLGHAIDSVYVGMYWRPAVGQRLQPGFTQDDLAGWMEVAADGQTAPATVLADPLHPDRASHEDSILRIFWNCDNDGDEGMVRGAAAVLLLEASRFPRLGFKAQLTSDDMAADDFGNAPRHLAVHTYRLFQAGVPYSQGGRPVTDQERFDAMSNDSKKRVEFPDLDNSGSYRVLFSVGPYVTLPADSTATLDVAFCVGRADYEGPAKNQVPTTLDDLPTFQRKFGGGMAQSLLKSCQEAWHTWGGTFRPNPRYRADTDPPLAGAHSCSPAGSPRHPGDSGRETCILAPPGRTLSYRDCRDPEGEFRDLSEVNCTWFDLDCDTTTGVCDIAGVPLVERERWLGEAPPVPPRMRVQPGDRQLEVLWDDQSEHIPDPGTGALDFKGYRLYRAANWKRDPATGPNGPNDDLWELVGDWARPGGAVNAGTLDQIRNPAFPEGPAGYDTGVSCPERLGSPCHVHRIGYYHFVDRNVIDGFRYFYAVTAYDQNPKPLSTRTTPLDTAVSQETGRSATEANVVVPRTDCAGDVQHVKVVPNPYRFKAAWDLRGSSTDPTGTHVNFNHLPCGRFTLRIFTAAGDLVRTFSDADARGGGTVEWSLVSRNGQDVKAGIYLYSIESDRGQKVGRFVLIR